MKESTKRGVLFRRIVVTLPILIVLASSAFVGKSLADKTIPMYEAPNREIKSLISKSQNSNSLFIALGPLEQLWSIYLTDRTINLLAQNTHVSSRKVKMVVGDYFIVFKDEKLNANFCPNFQEIDFETIESTTWFKLTKTKSTKDFACV